MEFHQLQLLIARYNAGLATESEKESLEQWYEGIQCESPQLDQEQRAAISQQIYTAVKARIDEMEKPVQTTAPTRVRWLAPVVKWAAACLIIALGSWFYLTNRKNSSSLADNKQKVFAKDTIVPGGNYATLTLSDGKTIALRDARDGKIADQGSTQVIKNGPDEVVYQPDYNNNLSIDQPSSNFVETPRGGTFKVVLPDGTKVWLNAASSLQFPYAFDKTERSVVLKGEGYFEVAKDPAKPFKVIFAGQTVEVLGTHFNINAYADEPVTKTTLLEGRVKVNGSQVLRPGQQFVQDKNGQTKLLMQAQTGDVVSWKNGYFNFKEADIYMIMREISRWYNADVSFPGTVPADHFSGKIPMNADLKYVFKILDANGIHCTSKGRLIIVR